MLQCPLQTWLWVSTAKKCTIGCARIDLKIKVDEALDYLGLLKFSNKKIDTFSGGMKRRVNLIAGILHNPKILFLDEPTVGVDVQSKNVIINYLKAVVVLIAQLKFLVLHQYVLQQKSSIKLIQHLAVLEL